MPGHGGEVGGLGFFVELTRRGIVRRVGRLGISEEIGASLAHAHELGKPEVRVGPWKRAHQVFQVKVGGIGEILLVPMQLAHEVGFDGRGPEFRSHQRLPAHGRILMMTGQVGGEPPGGDREGQTAQDHQLPARSGSFLLVAERPLKKLAAGPDEAGTRSGGQCAQKQLRQRVGGHAGRGTGIEDARQQELQPAAGEVGGQSQDRIAQKPARRGGRLALVPRPQQADRQKTARDADDHEDGDCRLDAAVPGQRSRHARE